MPSDKEIYTFTLLLRHFQLYQPESLYKVVCPFHSDVNASMQINIPQAFFYCYGCGIHGSSTELYQAFYKKQHNKSITTLQAKMAIAKLLAESTENHNSSKNFLSRTYDSLLSYISYNTSVNKANYLEGLNQAREYFKNLPTPCWYRPSNVPEIEEETRACLQYMQSRGFNKKLLTSCQAKPSLNKYYPITIPLLENGIFRGYVQRTFDKEIEQQRKYMYNRGFHREKVLAGNYKYIKPTVAKAKNETVLIVEGYLDCLKVQQLGIHNVAAILGWKISTTQLTKLQHAGIKHIICGTDNDEAGIKGYKYLKLVQKQQNWFKLTRVKFPKGVKDFGELQQGTRQAETMLRQLKNYGLK